LNGDVPTTRLRELVRVDQPLVLITQVQRSGGTLLQRLLDGHPQCHVLPFQFRGVDGAIKRAVSDPQEAWTALYDAKLADRFRQGYRQRKHDVLRDEEVFRFTLRPDLQRAIYDECTSRLEEPATRDLVACYLTAYFNAWLDYGGLSGEKRWVVAFEPGVSGGSARRAHLSRLYPDGRIISIVRDPWSWYASARRWEPRWRNRTDAVEHWCRVSKGALKWRKHTSPAFLTLSFNDLLGRTEETIRRVAAWLQIDYVPDLLVPTFNGRPIRANTSFADVSTEVSTRPLARADQELGADDMRYVTEHAGPLYQRLLAAVEKDRAAFPAA
jgi:Sulfotransferase family